MTWLKPRSKACKEHMEFLLTVLLLIIDDLGITAAERST